MTSTKEGCDLLSPKDDTTQSSPPPAASLDDDILVQYICHQKDAYFRHQQRDEEDLSSEEKQRIVGSLLHTNASVFLHRYGKFLDERFLQYIESQPEREHSDDINVQIAGLREKNRLRDSAVKNRRYNAMQKMLTEGVYFSNTEMQSRNPYLFEQMVQFTQYFF